MNGRVVRAAAVSLETTNSQCRSELGSSRRQWLAGASAAAGMAFVRSTAGHVIETAQEQGHRGGQAFDTKAWPYIDAHSHVWSPDVARWPLVKGQTRADLKPLSFTPEELF